MDRVTKKWEDLIRKQEVYRAKAIIEIAERDGENVEKLLSDMSVWPSVINELGLEVKPIVPKKKRADKYKKVEAWAKQNAGRTFRGAKEIYGELGVSEGTAGNYIRERRDLFGKIKKGEYIVNDVERS